MIISHKHKFIYFKSVKTASTTIEVFLSAYCGPDDIITRIREDRGREGFKWHKPTNHKEFFNHISARRVYNILEDKTIFDKYRKFTSVRNPWDIMVSRHHFFNKKGLSFEDWLKQGVKKGGSDLTRYYKLNGEIIIDNFIRFETLRNDLIGICNILNIEFSDEYFLHLKNRKQEKPYREYYNDETKALVAEKFAEEIKDLNYKF